MCVLVYVHVCMYVCTCVCEYIATHVSMTHIIACPCVITYTLLLISYNLDTVSMVISITPNVYLYTCIILFIVQA